MNEITETRPIAAAPDDLWNDVKSAKQYIDGTIEELESLLNAPPEAPPENYRQVVANALSAAVSASVMLNFREPCVPFQLAFVRSQS